MMLAPDRGAVPGRRAADPLTVAVDARLDNGLAGGVQQFVLGLASALCALDDGTEDYRFLGRRTEQGWLLPYLGPRGSLMAATSPLQGVQGFRRQIGEHVPGARRLAGRLRKARLPNEVALAASDGTLESSGIDVIHFTFQDAFITNIPSIYQPWDLQHVHLPEFFTEAQRRWRDAAYRRFSDQADVVVVASDWGRRDVIQHLGVPASKVVVIGVPPPVRAYPDPDASTIEGTRARLELPDAFAFYPAQTWPHKNHVRLLEALAAIRDRSGTEVPLVCSGVQNAHHAEILRAARRLGLERSVRFIGYVDPLDVQVLYRLARLLVFPSLFEGWGLPIVEAFATGLPVACSRVTSLPDLVGDAALLFDPLEVDAIADAILSLWYDDDLRSVLAARGHAVVARYDWRTTAQTYRALYRSIAGRELDDDDQGLLLQSTRTTAL